MSLSIIGRFSMNMKEKVPEIVVLHMNKSSNSLSCDRSIASSKLSSPSFLLQLPVSSCFLQVIQQLLTSPSSPSCPSNLSFDDVFQKAVRTQYVPNSVRLPSSYCVENVPFLLYSA
jgi:hypothetical protein